MKLFTTRELLDAYAHAAAGGQALHVHRIAPSIETAPKCFREAFRRGEDLAHLFDQDLLRLRRTAVELGVLRVRVEDTGTERQHVDLCGGPLKLARRWCEEATKD